MNDALSFMQSVFSGYDRSVEIPAVCDAYWNAHRPSFDALAAATHASCGLFQRDPDGGFVCRKETWTGGAVLMLDDIGSKCDAPLLPPTWCMETSPGSQQWGYVLDKPVRNPAVFGELFDAAARAGINDPGSRNVTRWFRLPGSKPKGKAYAAKLLMLKPEVRYSLHDLIRGLGLNMHLKAMNRKPFKPLVATAPDALVSDPLLAWLYQQSLVRRDCHNGWVEVTCPWAHEHSNTDERAYYHPANRDDLGRAFHCRHSHNPSWADFVNHCVAKGAPSVSLCAVEKGGRYV